MRIGWATPFNVRSAIGKYSLFVCDELRSRGYQVEVIRTETGPELEMRALDCELQVVEASTCDVRDYDVLAVNFANDAPHHAQILSLLARRAPLGIFHDNEMRSFERDLYSRHHVRLPTLIGGEHEPAESSNDLVDPAARPILAVLAAMSCGAVVHGPHCRETVSAFCPGPVELIPLCFPDTGKARKAPPRSPGRRVAIFGVITDRKQPQRVLRALAMIRSRVGAIELHLAGECAEDLRASLVEQADELGATRPVFHGYVSDERLQEILEDSHAICCLRYPVTEGSSASLATALYRARPVVISDIASFSLVPDETAHKVSYSEDPQDLADALSRIFATPGVAEKKAANAKKWAAKAFSARSYADALEPLLLSIKNGSSLTHAARKLVPAITTPDHEPMPASVHAFANVLDWMEASQK